MTGFKRNFEPLHRLVELWRKTQVTDERAKLIFYNAFIDGALDAPRKAALLVVYFVGLVAYSSAQQPKKFHIAVDSSKCDDSIGSSFAYEFREAIRRSTSYALDVDGQLKVALLCIDITQGGIASAVSVVVVGKNQYQCAAGDIFLLHASYVVPATRTKDMSQGLLSSIDANLTGGHWGSFWVPY